MKRLARFGFVIGLAVLTAGLSELGAQQAEPDQDGFESVFKVYLNNPDPVKAAAAQNELIRLSETGNPLAQFYYGHLLVSTSEGNSETARKLFSQSYPKIAGMARDGNNTAAYLVTFSYKYGYATPINRRKAFTLRLQLAEKNYTPAAYAVGASYLAGAGVKTNGDKAVFWLAKAAQGGMADAAWLLGEAYRLGTGVRQSYQLAYYWYSVAAARGDVYAARAREEIKPQLSRRELWGSYRMLTKGDLAHYPAGEYTLWQRCLMAVGIILPWFKFMLLDEYIWLDAAAFGLAALLLSGAMFSWRRRRFLTDIPLMAIKDIFVGWVHVKGLISCARPLISYLARRQCVYYSWSVTEDWERTVQEEYLDKDGKKQVREKVERGSTVIGGWDDRAGFTLEDETAAVPVDSCGAEMDTVSSFYTTCRPGDQLYFGGCSAPEVTDTQHMRHYSESILPLHAPSTIFGHAAPAGAELAIKAGSGAPFYLISLSDAATEKASRLGSIIWLAALSLLAVMAFPVIRVWFLADKPGLAGFTLICLIAYGLLFFAFWFMMAFNGVIFLRNRVSQIRALIDVQLKRRRELVPRLAEAARGLGAYEQALLVKLAELRGTGYKPAYNGLLALAEAYPGLGAAERYLQLMAGIKDAEDKIAGARDSYFNAAAAYNTRLERLPDRLLLRLGLFKPAPVKNFAL
ncbi:MAG: LemA family protein [Elusimicrobia bacterium]|nr:LemA family protein [Elusimicrobiota bacterium]